MGIDAFGLAPLISERAVDAHHWVEATTIPAIVGDRQKSDLFHRERFDSVGGINRGRPVGEALAEHM